MVTSAEPGAAPRTRSPMAPRATPSATAPLLALLALAGARACRSLPAPVRPLSPDLSPLTFDCGLLAGFAPRSVGGRARRAGHAGCFLRMHAAVLRVQTARAELRARGPTAGAF